MKNFIGKILLVISLLISVSNYTMAIESLSFSQLEKIIFEMEQRGIDQKTIYIDRDKTVRYDFEILDNGYVLYSNNIDNIEILLKR